jgi:hypothetical protein
MRRPTEMRHWRKVTWAMAAWSAAIAIWIVVLLARSEPHCAHERFRSVCATDSNVGKGIGVVLLICAWLFGMLVLASIRFLTRPRRS